MLHVTWDTIRYSTIASGVLLHNLVFRRGEWDSNSLDILLRYLCASTIGAAVLFFFPVIQHDTILVSATDIPSLVMYHVLGIYASMLIYRWGFHRLRQFPGPFLARLSKIYLTIVTGKNMQAHEGLDRLHKDYGDYVRVGPNELSIVDPAAVNALYGNQATSRGPWYNMLGPLDGLGFTRDPVEHARTRKVVDQAFSSKAVASYEPVVSNCAAQFLHVIEKQAGAPIDVSNLVRRYSYEVMGHLILGEPFNTIGLDGGDTYLLDSIHHAGEIMGYLRHMLWLPYLVLKTPYCKAKKKEFMIFLENRFAARRQRKPEKPDVFAWMLEAYETGPKTERDTEKLHGLGYTTLLAGSDTLYSAMSLLFFHMARSKPLARSLQRELDLLPQLNNQALRKVNLLNGIIHETLRLHPPIASGMQRVTNKEGIHIGDKYIPGNVLVQIPIYSLQRDERSFVHADELIPERWTTQPELIKNRAAFLPFHAGPYVCPGRQVSMMEMRRLVAEVLRRYDIGFAPGQTAQEFVDGRVDAMSISPAPLRLVFTPRVVEGM
ncbi:cytochrome P450 monooxygenase [Aspergillus avenaceus]|uniref:Cytochrome P450 monooxygenase n=1 Tax=Aspergillus avenaceus TaxID=36643 RepID=A0A5N6U6N0_ASPAV|nr:cytochrome P450 monooxygenase [Aspergillus avenaceus]